MKYRLRAEQVLLELYLELDPVVSACARLQPSGWQNLQVKYGFGPTETPRKL